jgi:hypothetical protein
MRKTKVAALFVLVSFAAFALGGKEKYYYQPSPPNVPPRVADEIDPAVQKLIDDLGAEDWRTREKAGRDLAAMGDKALPQMRKALLSTDNPEIQRRLVVLVRKLDRERLIEPKRVTLNVKNQTAKQIVEAIAKQTGYRIDISNVQDTKHSFEFNNTPFWQAIDAVGGDAGFNVVAEYEADSVRVYSGDSANPYVAYSGPFRFVATNINSSRSIQLSGLNRRGGEARRNEHMNLSFQIQSEPKNPMMGVMQPELTEATDDLGGSLMPPQERNRYSSRYLNGGYRNHNSYMSVNLVRGDSGAKTIKKLKGQIEIVLLSGSVTDVAVTDVLKVKKKTFSGRHTELEFTSLDEDANRKGFYTVSFTAKKLGQNDPNRNDFYQWSNTLWQRIELLDDKGNKYFAYGPSTHNNNGQTVQLVMQFGTEDRRTGRPGTANFGPPTKFVINEWLTVSHEVPFEFKDIPLP